MAGMLLTRSGKRSEPLLKEALDRRENIPIVLGVLASIGSLELRPDLRRLSEDRDPMVAKAAREALRVLQVHEEMASSR